MLEQTALGTHRVTAHRLSAQEISSLVTFFVADFEKLRKKKTEKGQKKRNTNGNLHNLDVIRLTLMQLFGPNQTLVDGVL